MNISGGYILQPRTFDTSKASKFPPHVREIWLYLLRKANHSDVNISGTIIKRGQLLTRYSDILDALSWYVGFRKESYRKYHCEFAMKRLMKEGMITTTKTTRGIVVTICKYDFYQSPKNYETDNENDMKTTRNRQTSDTINKNEKNDKNEKNIISLRGENKIVSASLFNTLYELLSDQYYLEMLCMNNSIPDIERMKDYLKSFFVELETRGEPFKDQADAKHHFASWLKIVLKKERAAANRATRMQKENTGYVHPAANHKQENTKVDERF